MEIISELPVKIKKLYDDAVLPYYATADSAGMDCTAHTVSYNDAKKYWDYKLGFAIEIPTGYVGLLFPRSSVYKTGFSMCNCVGVIDSDYRGEVSAKFYAITNIFSDTVYKVNERCCQLIIVPYPKVKLIEANELTNTERGTNGYGSTGL